MGLTFKRDDELQKVLDKFAILPEDNPKEIDKPDLDKADAKSKKKRESDQSK